MQSITIEPAEITTNYEQNYPSYDIVDSSGNMVEKAEPEKGTTVPETGSPIPKLSKSQIGKARRQFITVQNPRVMVCKHRLDLKRQPRHRNCESCWWAWFQNNGEMVKTADEAYQSGHPEIIVMLQGQKFYDNFIRFMATVAKLESQMKPKEESHE